MGFFLPPTVDRYGQELMSQGAFNSALLAHLPFMELFSSGEFPSVVAARRCS